MGFKAQTFDIFAALFVGKNIYMKKKTQRQYLSSESSLNELDNASTIRENWFVTLPVKSDTIRQLYYLRKYSTEAKAAKASFKMSKTFNYFSTDLVVSF